MGGSATCRVCYNETKEKVSSLCGCRGGFLGGGERGHSTWPFQFQKLLNQRFPCSDSSGHKTHNLARRGMGSEHWISEISNWRRAPNHVIWKADIIIIDTARNDMEETARSNTEILARLLLSSPQKPLLIWLVVSWAPRRTPPYHDDVFDRHFENITVL